MQTYSLRDIKKERIAAADSVIGNRVGGEQCYYHQLVDANPSETNQSGAFRIEFPAALTTSIIEVTSCVSGEKAYHVYMQAYDDYDSIYREVCSRVDAMLSSAKPETTYLVLLNEQLIDKLGYSHHAVGERHDQLVSDAGRELDEALFRNLVTGFLISAQLAKETRGRELCEAMVALKRTYCASLDSQPALKEKIYQGIGLSSCTDGYSYLDVDDIVVWSRYPPNHPNMAGLVDYRRSPEIHFQLLLGKVHSAAKIPESAILVNDEPSQFLFTRITEDSSPVLTTDALEKFLSRKGDWLEKGKPLFKLMQIIEVAPPAVYWSQATKKGVIQFRASKMNVQAKIPLPVTENMLAARERHENVTSLKAMKPLVMPCSLCDADNTEAKVCQFCKTSLCYRCTSSDVCEQCVWKALVPWDLFCVIAVFICAIGLAYALW